MIVSVMPRNRNQIERNKNVAKGVLVEKRRFQKFASTKNESPRIFGGE
jgi:hypothetical protein